jgi:hypothetical protein
MLWASELKYPEDEDDTILQNVDFTAPLLKNHN